MQANNLKIIADKINKDAEDPKIQEILRLIETEVTTTAKYGKYSQTLYLSKFNVSNSIWNHVADRLRKDGFKVNFDEEITAWYSNTDYDQEKVIKISWL
jgi:tRNA G26 N,N-dimethylase Trm1